MDKKFLALAAVAALAACNKEDHTIVAGGPPDDGYNAAAEANVVLPPSIKASKTYRCGGDVVRVDWLSDDKSATVTPDKGSPIAVSTAEAGKPLTSADGTSLEGTAEAGSVKISIAGKPAASCKA